MTYKEFQQTAKQMHQTNESLYYSHLISFTDDILIDIALTNKDRVAQALGLSRLKLTSILPILKYLRTNSATLCE